MSPRRITSYRLLLISLTWSLTACTASPSEPQAVKPKGEQADASGSNAATAKPAEREVKVGGGGTVAVS